MRTSLSLSSLTGTPVRVFNVRSGRKVPGLRPQHLLSALSVSEITGGVLKGASVGSREVVFFPGPLKGGGFSFDVSKIASSAGSASLVFQTLLLPLSFSGGASSLVIKGGTHVQWSPSADYLKEVFIPVASFMGIRASIDDPLKGFYPIGGGVMEARIEPASLPLRPLDIPERGSLKRVAVTSAVSNLPESIAKRQIESAVKLLKSAGVSPEARSVEVPSPGRGTFVFICAEFEHMRAGFSSLGERGKSAERVGEEAAGAFLEYYRKKGALDKHLADQIIVPMSLAAGMSRISVAELTGHLYTNVHVIEKFLPVKFVIEGAPGGEGTVKVEGAAFKRR